MNTVITLEMILDAKACPDQVALFNHCYPIGFAVVTPENVLAAIVDGIDIHWAVAKLLRGEFRRSYNAAIAKLHEAFIAAIAEAEKVYDAAKAEAHRAYYVTLVGPYEVLNSAISEARKAYHAAKAEANRAYNPVLAQAFSNAFNAQCRAEVVV
jgi:hypothetical protein